MVQNSTVGTQSYGSFTMVEPKPFPETIVKHIHGTARRSEKVFGGLSRLLNVKLVAFPTQHLLNNRGFSSTLLKNAQAWKVTWRNEASAGLLKRAEKA